MMFRRSQASADPFRDYDNGRIIVPQGSDRQVMGLVGAGQVEVFRKTPDGDETVFGVLSKGDTFGTYSLFEAVPRPTGIRALGRARVALMDNREFIRYVHDNPELAFRMLTALSRRLQSLATDLRRGGQEVP